ncbi:dienelactone hydrolase family protein [Comamonas sp. 4034]|uniref:dienelactone hydrolase family protein n=1 Tax=Comamonas sp. 4034 TaxID=3156455 RepID=UPI003D1AA5E7
MGSVQGSAWVHTDASLKAVVENAWVVLPASVTSGAVYAGLLKNAPPTRGKAPLVVFVHGSSGVAPAIKTWQQWLADSLGIASLTADSMQLADRMTYKSPVAPEIYEKIHAMRAQELAAAVGAVTALPWADPQRLVIAGTSEGAVAVARYQAASAPQEKGRMIFSWSCEDNYHVQTHRSQLPQTLPVLNIMSSTDMYFSKANPWLDNPDAKGHCAEALAMNKVSSIVLIPGAPHTLFNLPQAQQAQVGFLRGVLALR